MKSQLLLSAILGIASFTALQAATLTGSGAKFTGTSAALPSSAGSDWAYYHTSPPVAGAPTNTSGDGPRAFTVSPFGPGATGLLGSGTNINTFGFSFTNGTSPINSSTDITGIRNNLVGDAAVGNGIQMSLAALPSASTITLWTYTFTSDATIKVYLYNSSGTISAIPDYTQTVGISTASGKTAYEFTFNYVPTGDKDDIRIEYVLTTSGGTAANIGFAGIAITPVPEPGVVTLAGFAVLALGARRRR